MRFKRLVSGIAALTVAMGTFATMTITASAVGAFSQEYTDEFAIRFVCDGVVLEDANLAERYKKPSTLEDFKTNITESFTKGEILGKEYLSESSETTYIIESVNKKDPLTSEEIQAIDNSKSPQGNSVIDDVTVDKGDYVVKGRSFYWYTVTVHEQKSYTFSIKRNFGGEDEDYTDINSGVVKSGKWTYTEGDSLSDVQSTDVSFPRFYFNESDSTLYELGAMSGTSDRWGVTKKDSSRFTITFDPTKFVSFGSSEALELSYSKYPGVNGLKYVTFVDPDGASDAQASGGKSVRSGMVEVEGLHAGQDYTFIVTHTGTLQDSDISLAYMPVGPDGWKETSIKKTATKDGTATIQVPTSGKIDTVVVYGKEADKITFTADSYGLNAGESKIKEEFIPHHVDEDLKQKLGYSYPLYVKSENKLYRLQSIIEDGTPRDPDTFMHDANKVESYDKDKTFIYSYIEDNRSGYGNLQSVIEADTYEKVDPTASRATASNGYTISTIDPGKHTYIVRFKGDTLSIQGADQQSASGSDTDWTEATITLTVLPTTGTGRLILSGALIDTIIEYKSEVETTVELKMLGRATFNDPKATDAQLSAEAWQATVTEGTDGVTYKLTAKFVDGNGTTTEWDGAGCPQITGSSAVNFGFIMPINCTVTPEAVKMVE